MADYDRMQPGGSPRVPDELAQVMRAAIDLPDENGAVQLRMTIAGGVADERYDFHFEATSAGVVRADMSCRMTGRHVDPAIGALSRADIVGLLHAAEAVQRAGVRRPPRPVPPCSLLGRIEILGGTQRMSFVFMADAEQAKQAGMEPPRELAALVDRVFDVSTKGAKAAGAQSLRP
jgi:hypothetical protein